MREERTEKKIEQYNNNRECTQLHRKLYKGYAL